MGVWWLKGATGCGGRGGAGRVNAGTNAKNVEKERHEDVGDVKIRCNFLLTATSDRF